MAAVLLARPDAAQAQCSGSGTQTSCVAETRSATTTVTGGGPLGSLLQQALAGANSNAITSLLAQVLGPGSFSQSTNVTVHQFFNIGPGTIPVGPGPGTINCTGTPIGWPASNCNFTGYTTFFVLAGTTNVLTDTHTDFATTVNLAANSAGLNFLNGDLHTTFQTTLIDDGFRFVDTLLSRGSEDGATSLMFSPTPLAFAADTMQAAAPFEDALAFATKAPKVPMTANMGDGWRAWIRGSFARATFESTSGNFGFKYGTLSGEGGIERVVGPWLYGAALGYGRAKVTQDVTGDNGTIDTIRAGAYASYRPGPWWVTGAVALGVSNIDSTRLSLMPTPATATYHATTVSAGVEARRRYQLSGITAEPLVGLTYTGLWVDSFSEGGTTLLEIAGNRAHIDALKGYAGGRLYRAVLAPNGWVWTPEVRGRFLYDFLDDARGFTARFIADPAATPIPVTGLQPERFATMLGGSLNVRVTPTWRSFVSYDAELRGNDVAHLVSGGVKGNW